MSSTTMESFDRGVVVRRPAVRLTRRGRAVVLVVALVVLLALGFVGASFAGASTHRGHLATHHMTVQPGDTLWGVASKAAHGGDVRAMELEIRDLNGMSTSVLYVGQPLVVPN